MKPENLLDSRRILLKILWKCKEIMEKLKDFEEMLGKFRATPTSIIILSKWNFKVNFY